MIQYKVNKLHNVKNYINKRMAQIQSKNIVNKKDILCQV